MKGPISSDKQLQDWVRVNVGHKVAGHQLLALTAFREQTLKTHWLRSDGEVAEENLHIEGGHFPSLTPYLAEVAWDEREIHDLYGYVPDGHPDLRPLVRTPRWPEIFFPLQNKQELHPEWHQVEPDNPSQIVEGEGVTIMKVGPTHAGIIESGHFVFSIMGENVLHLDAHLFQNHRGVEKALEGLPLSNALSTVSRICGADSASHQMNFISAVENLAARKTPEPIQWQRVILLEAERILSHLNDLSQIPAGVGFPVANQRGLAMKENWQRGLAKVFGHRFLFDTIRFDMAPIRDIDELKEMIELLERDWGRWRKLVDNHHGFHDRMKGVGVVRRDDANRLGAVGVALRATGIPFDVRAQMPTYSMVQSQFANFDGGDVEARFQVRLQEVENSIYILKTAIKHIDAQALFPAWKPPLDITGDVVSYSESPHGLNVHVIQIKQGQICRYHVRSGAFRNWPVLALAVAGNTVADFPLINKSFELCYSCTDR